MSAFLFTGWTTVFDPKRGLTDACFTSILHGCDELQGRAWFEGWLQRGGRDADQTPRRIEQITVTPIVDRLFTETGDEPLDWAALDGEAAPALTAGEDAYDQQGYWADGNALVPPAPLAPDLDALHRNLPDDVRSGLNWSADAQNVFLVSALAFPTPVPEPDYDNPDPTPEASLDAHREPPFPELAAKEATAVIRARNTVVAAWLWRRYTAQTRLAGNPIRVDSWCSVVGPEKDTA
jgi:hypothetical protein